MMKQKRARFILSEHFSKNRDKAKIFKKRSDKNEIGFRQRDDQKKKERKRRPLLTF
tara:strand:+ start:317 stop:484 length:168 start_codon:yes stop_codon:yes gene_type:complete